MLELASSLEALTTSLDPSDTANKAFFTIVLSNSKIS